MKKNPGRNGSYLDGAYLMNNEFLVFSVMCMYISLSAPVSMVLIPKEGVFTIDLVFVPPLEGVAGCCWVSRPEWCF